jgi:anti-anti-sigma regulatory factor
MEISVVQAQGNVPVTLLRVSGDIDGATCRDLIAKGQEVFNAGERALLINLKYTSFISSAGIAALHTLSKIMRGAQPIESESGWETLHAIDGKRRSGRQKISS